MSDDASCQFCTSPVEDLNHLFRFCPNALSLYRSFHWMPISISSTSQDFHEWLYLNLKGSCPLNPNILWQPFFSILLWHTWKNRCKRIFEEHIRCNQTSSHAVWHAYIEWMDCCNKENPAATPCPATLKWSLPAPNTFKINVDGSLRSGDGNIFAGGIMRNDAGEWVKGFRCNLGKGGILEAELWGILNGCKMAANSGVIVIESDSLEAVNLILKKDVRYHPLAGLILDCRNILRSKVSCTLKHISRLANFVADHLAKSWPHENLGFEDYIEAPYSATPFLLADCPTPGAMSPIIV